MYRILRDRTDCEHSLRLSDIQNELQRCGVSVQRKALYEDLEALTLYGLDIRADKGRYAKYRLYSREFELAELKLLADAVCSARFLTESKSAALLKKIEGLASVYEASQIKRQVYVTDRVKAYNEKIYRSVDVIHRAIADKRKIKFKYFDYNVHKEKVYREGMRVCTPYALTWDDGKYYLVAYHPKYDRCANFRVDRMDFVTETDEVGHEMPKNFNLAEYLNSNFSMFGGDTQTVRLRFENSLVNAVVDRFGQGVTMIPDGDSHFIVRANVSPQPPFFAWLFQFGAAAQILSPDSVRQQYLERLHAIMKNFNK